MATEMSGSSTNQAIQSIASNPPAISMQIHPLCLRIRPANLEHEFWSQRRILQQLMNIDRFAFVMSSLNLYSGWNAAAAMESTPLARASMQALCALFFLLSSAQQLLMQQQPVWYLRHRQAIITATRLMRGSWMVAMFIMCSERDIVAFFVARKLEQDVSQELVVVQLLLMLSLIFIAQCLIWPLPFKQALPLQLLYILSALLVMNNVKCVVNYPELAAGTQRLCCWIRLAIDALSAFLTDCHGVVIDAAARHNNSSSSNLGQAISSERCHEEVVCCVIWTCGLLLPLYITYLRELTQKQRFLQNVCRQLHNRGEDMAESRQQQQQQCLELGSALNVGLLLHAAALALLLIVSALCCQLLLLVLPEPVCA